MLTLVLYTAGAVALLALGWVASAWFHQRQIRSLALQVKLVKATAAEHAGQARRQIGQLQAELAARPPARSRPARVAPANDDAADDRRQPMPAPTPGFAPTEIGPHGFLPTQVLR